MLRTKLRIEPETDLGLYLGCMLTRGESKLHDGTMVNTVSYNMEGLLKLSVEKYLDIVGHETKMKKVNTPSLPEETKEHPARVPAPGRECTTCPWCANAFDPKFSSKTSSKANEDVNVTGESRGALPCVRSKCQVKSHRDLASAKSPDDLYQVLGNQVADETAKLINKQELPVLKEVAGNISQRSKLHWKPFIWFLSVLD